MTTRTFVDGKVHVRKNRCATCIFGRRSPVSVERREGMIREADEAESCIPCHSHLYQGAEIEPVCAGYAQRGSSMTLRLAGALGAIQTVS